MDKAKAEAKKVKLDTLLFWQRQIVEDAMDTETVKKHSKEEQSAYKAGLMLGMAKFTSCLSRNDVIKLN